MSCINAYSHSCFVRILRTLKRQRTLRTLLKAKARILRLVRSKHARI